MVKQEGKYDCGAACLAMALGLPLEVIRQIIGYDPNTATPRGLYDSEMCEVLTLSGSIVGYSLPKEQLCEGEPYDLSDRRAIPSLAELKTRLISFLNTQIQGIKFHAILAVASQNGEAGHYVYCKGNEVFDPSLLKTYSCTIQELPIMAIIFITTQ